MPGFRVVAGSLLPVRQAIAMPARHGAGLPYLTEFVEYARRSGLVERAIRRAGIRGANVTP